jgi:hypothetical protein
MVFWPGLISPQGIPGNGYAFTFEKEVEAGKRVDYALLHFQ